MCTCVCPILNKIVWKDITEEQRLEGRKRTRAMMMFEGF
jgi:hypothetical protein